MNVKAEPRKAFPLVGSARESHHMDDLSGVGSSSYGGGSGAGRPISPQGVYQPLVAPSPQPSTTYSDPQVPYYYAGSAYAGSDHDPNAGNYYGQYAGAQPQVQPGGNGAAGAPYDPNTGVVYDYGYGYYPPQQPQAGTMGSAHGGSAHGGSQYAHGGR